MRRADTQPTTLFEDGERGSERGGERHGQTGHVADGSIEPGRDHYVRSGGKLIAILLASVYPTEWELEQARRDYERGVDGAVELSSRRRAEADSQAEEETDS